MKKYILIIGLIVLLLSITACDTELGRSDEDHDHDGDGEQDHAAEYHDEEEQHEEESYEEETSQK